MRSHVEYRTKDGGIVPSVTQVLKIISIPALAPAANRLGLLGINSNTYWKELADIGTISHFLILCYLKKVKPDTSGYKKNLVDKAENSFLSYLDWEKNHKIEPVLLETPLVSEVFKFGGTPDCVCHLDDKEGLTLLDFKTGGIYKEHYWQIAGYTCLLEENGYSIDDGIILGIPRTVDEFFIEQEIEHIHIQASGLIPFLKCLELYNAIKDYEEATKEEKCPM